LSPLAANPFIAVIVSNKAAAIIKARLDGKE
jgi:hypothetical protein